MLQRSLLTTAAVSLAGALTPTIPAKAGIDPVAFVNNLTTQLEMAALGDSTNPLADGVAEEGLGRAVECSPPGRGNFSLPEPVRGAILVNGNFRIDTPGSLRRDAGSMALLGIWRMPV
jgi:hypothetical protein